MLSLRLRDTTLLKCSFEERLDDDEPEGANPPDEEQEPEAPLEGYPEDQLLLLSVESSVDGKDAVAFIEGKLEDPRLPFLLSFEMAFLYSIPEDEEMPESSEVEPTLVWLAFPYMREFIADLTGRSPSPQYFIPPLTRLPMPDQESPSPESG